MLFANVGIPFLVALALGGVLAAAFGGLLGIPTLRLEGPYLAIATLGFGLAVTIFIGRLSIFGGHMGLTVPRIDLKWTGLPYNTAVYLLIVGITVFLTIATSNVLRSKIGRAFQAIRDSDIAASAAGVNLARYKIMSFSISAFYAGIAGGLWALLLGFINPGLFNIIMSITFLVMIVLGGLGTVTGSILGAVVLTLLNLQLDNIVEVPVIGPALQSFSERFMNDGGLPNIRHIITGMILILIIIWEPLGLFGLWIRTKIYWKSWPF